MTQAPPRPPRPAHIDPDVLAQVASKLGMARREIIDVTDTDAGRIVTTHDHHRVIIVPPDKPDALGQTGVLALNAPPSYRGKSYVAPDSPLMNKINPTAEDGWTVQDLDVEAHRVLIPALVGGKNGPSLVPWMGNDPVRARAAWQRVAAGMGTTTAAAAVQNTTAAMYRQIVLDSGWLRAGEADRL